MKPPGKKKNSLMALVVMGILLIGIMFVSVLSYPFLNAQGSKNQGSTDVITGAVMKENLSSEARYQYMQQGLTFLEIHYDYLTDLKSIEYFPQQFTTPLNQIQLIIIEIPDNDKQYALIQSINGEEEINSTNLNDIANGLCRLLTYTPVECVAGKLGSNETNSSTEKEMTGPNATNYNAI